MTPQELEQFAEHVWEDSSSNGNINDKQVWIDGFMTGFTYSYASSEDLSTFIKNQKDLGPEFGKIISDNFNDLI
jgi:hypothetical protein